MFEEFKKYFLPDSASIPAVPEDGAGLPPDIAKLLAEFGGKSFNGGLYRVMRASDAEVWKSRIEQAFPHFKGRVTCFGYDWLGRAFATDANCLEAGKPGVLMFTLEKVQALKIPANIDTFHDEVVIKFTEEVLGIEGFLEWQNTACQQLEYNQCAGYKIPPFLGGTGSLDNLEISEIDVYWHIMGQVIVQVRGLPPGARIDRVKIS